MKRLNKIISIVLVIVTIMMISGCSKKTGNIRTGENFTYWVSVDNNVARTLTSFNELLMYQEMEKRTGTKVDFIHPASGTTGSEAFQILMASGDYPDMIEYKWNTYTGGPGQAIDDGVIIALNDYLEEYAPNYNYYMEGEGGKANNYRFKADSLSKDGSYYGFKNLNVGSYRGYDGFYVRKDLLDKWGLDIPETIADWENLFKVAKENGIKYPITCQSWDVFGVYSENGFNGAWGVGNDFYLDGNKVKFGPFESEYKEYIEKMAEWMKLGYIDPDYVTNDSTIVRGQITNGTSIASRGYVGGDLGAIIPAMLERDPGFKIVACPFPVMKEGDTPIFQSVQAEASDPSIAISVQCGADDENRYKEAIQWCDYLYSEDGMVLKCFGVEGDTFTIEKDEDGNEHYIYTDKVKNYKEFGATNISAALYHFFLPANHPGFNQHPDYFNGYYEYQEQKDAIELWNKHVEVAKKHKYPEVSYTGDEASKIAVIESNGMSNLKAAISNIILGKASIDSYDDAIKDAKKAGYDELLKIKQAAYDRYVSVIEK